MEIKILKPKDINWEEYKQLRLHALQTEPQAFATSYQTEKDTPDNEWQARLEKYKEGNGNWMFFASDGQSLVGMLGAYQTDDDREDMSANVIAMFVSGEARGKGVSKLLMNHLLEELKDKSIKKAKLSVNKEQEAPLGLYKSLGFEIVGDDEIKLGDNKTHEEFVMVKKLS